MTGRDSWVSQILITLQHVTHHVSDMNVLENRETHQFWDCQRPLNWVGNSTCIYLSRKTLEDLKRSSGHIRSFPIPFSCSSKQHLQVQVHIYTHNACRYHQVINIISVFLHTSLTVDVGEKKKLFSHTFYRLIYENIFETCKEILFPFADFPFFFSSLYKNEKNERKVHPTQISNTTPWSTEKIHLLHKFSCSLWNFRWEHISSHYRDSSTTPSHPTDNENRFLVD